MHLLFFIKLFCFLQVFFSKELNLLCVICKKVWCLNDYIVKNNQERKSKMTIVSIWCRHKGDNVIGAGLGLPWKIPSDTKRFRQLTEGQVKVMGGRTYSGMPQKVLVGRKVIVLDNTASTELFDTENHVLVDDINKLKDYPEDLYISGGAFVYFLFFSTPALMPDVVVDCVYGGPIDAGAQNLIDVNKSVEILEQKYSALPQRFELDGVVTTVWVKKDDFVNQAVVKKILNYLETEGK
jgi:hypothetical protein